MLLLLFGKSLIFGQSLHNLGTIRGIILDDATLQPIPFCNVYIKEINKGSVTDEEGKFSIEKIPEGKYTLFVSYLGYEEKTIPELNILPNRTSYIEVKLIENTQILDNVEIKTYKYEKLKSMPIGTYSLSREEIYRSPASNGNIFKAISVIPGVQSGGGSFSALAVRGQGAEENAMFVEGFPVFDLSHLAGGAGSGISGGFDDPNGGRFSIFGPKVINGLVIQTGGFSALYGRKSSSYLGLSIKSGNPENAEIDFLGSLTGASVTYSGPSFLKKSTLFSSIRYQNFVPALNLTKQSELGFPSFLDFTMKSTTQLNKSNKLTVLILLNPEWFIRNTSNVAKDKKLENVVLANLKRNKGLLGLKLQTLVGKKNNLTNLVFLRFKSTDVNFGKAYPRFRTDGSLPNASDIPFNDKKGNLNSKESEVGMRSIYAINSIKKIKIKVGTEFAVNHLDYNRTLFERDTIYSFYRNEMPANQQNQNYVTIEPENFNSSFLDNTVNFSIFANSQFYPFQKLVTNLGFRYDYTGFSRVGRMSPRLSFSYDLTEKTSLNAATGIFYQDPLFVQVAENKNVILKPEKAMHYILGVKHYFSRDLKFTIEGYYKKFSNLIVRPNSFLNILKNQGTGFAYGIDINLVKRLSNKYNGIVSYSYSQSKRNNIDGKGLYNHLYSQPHIFNFLLSYQPNDLWIFSGKFRYSTGQPTNSSIIFKNVFNNTNFLRYGQELIGKNDIRNDDFIGIDIRIDKKYRFKSYNLNMYFDVQNITNRTNASTKVFFETTGNYRPEALGILPTFGIQIEM